MFILSFYILWFHNRVESKSDNTYIRYMRYFFHPQWCNRITFPMYEILTTPQEEGNYVTFLLSDSFQNLYLLQTKQSSGSLIFSKKHTFRTMLQECLHLGSDKQTTRLPIAHSGYREWPIFGCL